ncbi:hypothetical protein EV359DRAFT_50949, partial [Lentinula novae-zelandiae]
AQKLEQHLQIATAMIGIAKALKNKEQYDCWSAILNSIDRLGAAGMSDDEQVLDTHGQQGIIVYAPVFRHPHFDALFDKVDSTWGLEKYLFTRVGQCRLPRIRGHERVERSPRENLPPSYYQPNFLHAMDKGLVEMVAIATEETAILRCGFLYRRRSRKSLILDSSQ